MKKTYRIKLDLNDDGKPTIYRTDGIPTHCCSLSVDYFFWEKNTKYNNYNGLSGYVDANLIRKSLATYNPDNLTV